MLDAMSDSVVVNDDFSQRLPPESICSTESSSSDSQQTVLHCDDDVKSTSSSVLDFWPSSDLPTQIGGISNSFGHLREFSSSSNCPSLGSVGSTSTSVFHRRRFVSSSRSKESASSSRRPTEQKIGRLPVVTGRLSKNVHRISSEVTTSSGQVTTGSGGQLTANSGDDPPRRKNTPLACNHCYKAKTKCDARRPCGRCIQFEKTGCVDRDNLRRPRMSIACVT